SALSGVERRHADQPVHADLAREQPISVIALNTEAGRLDSGLFTGLIIEHLGLELVTFAAAQIHSQQHLGPILRVSSARPRVDRDYGFEQIVIAADPLPRLALLDLLREAFKRFTQLARRSLVISREFKQHCDVIKESLLAFSGVDRALQSRAQPQNFLGL